jgi:hypothetical protein
MNRFLGGFDGGLQISSALPELLTDIQLQLLDLLSLALAKRPFNQFTHPSKVQALNAALTTGKHSRLYILGCSLSKAGIHSFKALYSN